MAKYIIVLVLVGHGVGHAIGFLAAWTQLPMGFRDHPWILGGEITIQSAAGRVFGLLWLAALAGFLAAALGLLSGRPWWGALAVASSVISVIAIVPWWNTVGTSPRNWALLVDVVVLIGLRGPWQDRIGLLLE